jgi:hypothetical protein
VRFQGRIDTLPAGQPFEADDEEKALAHLDAMYDGMDCGGKHLTTNGETLTVERVPA